MSRQRFTLGEVDARALTPVVVESPFRAADPGEHAAHLRYLGDAILDCIYRGEAPYASHSYLPNYLDDHHPVERELGIEVGLTIARALDATHAVYHDRGITEGMRAAIERALAEGRQVEYRSLDAWRK